VSRHNWVSYTEHSSALRVQGLTYGLELIIKKQSWPLMAQRRILPLYCARFGNGAIVALIVVQSIMLHFVAQQSLFLPCLTLSLDCGAIPCFDSGVIHVYLD